MQIDYKTSQETIEEVRHHVKTVFVPAVKADIEYAWHMWAARPLDNGLQNDYRFGWVSERMREDVPIHGLDTSADDLKDSLQEFMFLWLLSCEDGDSGIGDATVWPTIMDSDHHLTDWIAHLEYCWSEVQSGITSKEDFDTFTTDVYVDYSGYGYNLAIGFNFLNGEDVDWETVAVVSMLPSNDFYSDPHKVMQQWAFEYFVEEAETNANRFRNQKKYAATT